MSPGLPSELPGTPSVGELIRGAAPTFSFERLAPSAVAAAA